MRVLVTGASGFVGRVLCVRLLREKVSLIAATRGSVGVDHLLGDMPHGKSRVAHLDLAAAARDLGPILEEVDAVVHLAAKAHVAEEQAAREQYFALNTEATERLARAAQRAGVHRFVFASTAKIYGEFSVRDAFAESAAPRPQGAYAESKCRAEQVLRQIANETGLDVVILRPPLMYGPQVKGNLRQLLDAIAAGWPLPLAGIANRRSMLGVQNFADAIMHCLSDPRVARQTFNVSDPVPLSTPELVCELAAALGRKPRLWRVPLPLLDVLAKSTGRSAAFQRLTADFVLDATHIARTLQWQAPVPRSHGIARMVDWYSKEVDRRNRR